MKQNTLIKGAILLLIAAMSWGAMFPIAKTALFSLDGFYLSLVRYGIASIIFLILLVIVEGWRSVKLDGKSKTIFFRGSMGFAGFSILAFVGLSYSTSAHAAIIMALMPLITVVINWITKGIKPNNITLVCISAALFGVSLVVTKGHVGTLSSNQSVFGDILILLGAASWVLYTLGAANVPSWSPLRYTALSATLGTITIVIATIIATSIGFIQIPSLVTIFSVKWQMLYLILIAGVLAVLSWNNGIKCLGSINGVLFINLVPVTAFIIGAFEGQQFSIAEFSGALITILALISNNLNARRITRISALSVPISKG